MKLFIPVESMTGIGFLCTVILIALSLAANCLLSYRLLMFRKDNKKITENSDDLMQGYNTLLKKHNALVNRHNTLIEINKKLLEEQHIKKLEELLAGTKLVILSIEKNFCVAQTIDDYNAGKGENKFKFYNLEKNKLEKLKTYSIERIDTIDAGDRNILIYTPLYNADISLESDPEYPIILN